MLRQPPRSAYRAHLPIIIAGNENCHLRGFPRVHFRTIGDVISWCVLCVMFYVPCIPCLTGTRRLAVAGVQDLPLAVSVLRTFSRHPPFILPDSRITRLFLPAGRLADWQICRPANLPTCKLADLPTCKLALLPSRQIALSRLKCTRFQVYRGLIASTHHHIENAGSLGFPVIGWLR